MTFAFGASLQSEWLKKKRTLAVWMVIIGSFFTPAIITIVRLVRHEQLARIYSAENYWQNLWHSSWESIAIFLLPIGSILATSLTAQLEYRNNAWKQLHTLPVSYSTIFFSKLTIILVMLAQFFTLFNIGIYLSAVIPYLLISGVPFPQGPIPVGTFLLEDLWFFIDTLPIVGLQYLLSLHFRNFVVSLGAGFLLWVASIACLSWKFGYLVPYTYPMYNFLKGAEKSRAIVPPVNIHLMAGGYFILFVILGFILYFTKKEKG